jgi:hypothetical protein
MFFDIVGFLSEAVGNCVTIWNTFDTFIFLIFFCFIYFLTRL